MFIVPSEDRVLFAFGRPALLYAVKAYKRNRNSKTLSLRVSEDVIATLGWDSVSRVRVRVGAGKDAGRVLLVADAGDGPAVRITRPAKAKAFAIHVHGSFIGRLAPTKTITLPHSFQAVPGTDRFALALDVRALPLWEGASHAA